MKCSELWLKELVHINCNSLTLIEQMTMLGIEVESINLATEKFSGIVIGEIISYELFARENNLIRLKVNVGTDKYLTIICKSFNYINNSRVVVATHSSVFAKNKKIEEQCFHDEISEAILCSYYELGLSNSNDLIELPQNAPIGIDIRKYLKLDDNIINVKVTPNRADCLSILGIAREIAAINKLPLIEPQIIPIKPTINETYVVKVHETEACPRSLSRIIKEINIKINIPLEIKEKLRRCGIDSIDPITDITNYVLLELGQPITAFDLDNINGNIIIRMAEKDEWISLVDEKKITLDQDTLIIADNSHILALAGIVSSTYASITSNTSNIILECAFFKPTAIIGRARRYGLQTNSSHRYERGVDSKLQYKAIERTTNLILEICGGYPGPIIDNTCQDTLPESIIVTLYRNKLDSLLGYYIEDNTVTEILQSIGCKVEVKKDQWITTIPSWRFDLCIAEDLIEEIIRLYGYNKLPDVPIIDTLTMVQHQESNISLNRVKTLLVDKGYHEAITYSFVNPKIQKLLHPNNKEVILIKPISNEMSVMRVSLWTGLINTAIYNINRQQNYVRLFETGLCFFKDDHAEFGIRQELMIGGIITNSSYKEHWDINYQLIDFYDLKGDVESIIELSNKLNDVEFRAEIHPALHPGKSAAIFLEKEKIGFIGELSPKITEKLKINYCLLMFELKWNKITKYKISKVDNIPLFPSNRRDISIMVPKELPAGDVINLCKKVDLNQIIDIKLFDVFQGPSIKEGYKNLTISLVLQNKYHTLEEKEIVAIVSQCIAALEKKFQAILRC